jgi:hypothetical protein
MMMTRSWQTWRPVINLKNERESTVIDEQDYKLPKQQPKIEQTEDERRRAAETLAYLESLPWRPHGIEW